MIGSTSELNKDSESCENLHQDKKQKESLALFHVLIKCQNDATNSDGDFVEALPRGEVGLCRPHQPVEAAGGVAGAALDPPLGSYPRGARGDVWRKKGQNSYFPIIEIFPFFSFDSPTCIEGRRMPQKTPKPEFSCACRKDTVPW